MAKVYAVRGRRARTVYQDTTIQISEQELAAKLAELEWPDDDRFLKLALESILDDREHDIEWTTDDADTNDLRVRDFTVSEEAADA